MIPSHAASLLRSLAALILAIAPASTSAHLHALATPNQMQCPVSKHSPRGKVLPDDRVDTGVKGAFLRVGPNAFGYVASTYSDGACGMDFIDLVFGSNAVPALATSVANGNAFGPRDDARTTQAIALGGAGARIYGETFSQAVMSTNGYVSFSNAESGGDFSNDCGGPFDHGAAGPQLRVHHDDLVLSLQPGAGLRYRYFSTCPRAGDRNEWQPEGCHVFQWSRMQAYVNGGVAEGDFEFEAIVYERTEQIAYLYRFLAPDNGAGATIGVIDANAADPLTVRCNEADNSAEALAVCIYATYPVFNDGFE